MIYIILIDEQINLATNDSVEVIKTLRKIINENNSISAIVQIWEDNKMIKRIVYTNKNQETIDEILSQTKSKNSFLRTRIIQVLKEYDPTNPTISSLIQYLQNRENII